MPIKPTLTLQLRRDLNRLANLLNERISQAIETYGKSKQPDNTPHAPGWFRNRIWYVDPNIQFSESGVHSLNDPSIYFIPWSGETAPANASLSDIQADPNTCAQDPSYGYDDVFTYNCSINIDLAQPGANQNIPLVLPEDYVKVFHPRPNGHTALKIMAHAAMISLRPQERGQPACSGNIPDSSSNLTIQVNSDGSPNPSLTPQCMQPPNSTTSAGASSTSPTAPGATTSAGYTGGTCHIYVQEKLTCASDPTNLRAYVALNDSTGKTIGTSGDSNTLGPEINANDPYNLQSSLPNPITITGEHTNDYVQFSYGGLQWQSGDTQQNGGNPYCDTQPWSQNSGCIGGLAGATTSVVSVCSNWILISCCSF